MNLKPASDESHTFNKSLTEVYHLHTRIFLSNISIAIKVNDNTLARLWKHQQAKYTINWIKLYNVILLHQKYQSNNYHVQHMYWINTCSCRSWGVLTFKWTWFTLHLARNLLTSSVLSTESSTTIHVSSSTCNNVWYNLVRSAFWVQRVWVGVIMTILGLPGSVCVAGTCCWFDWRLFVDLARPSTSHALLSSCLNVCISPSRRYMFLSYCLYLLTHSVTPCTNEREREKQNNNIKVCT